MDVAAIKRRVARTWGFGDYSVLGRMLEPAAATLREACGVSAGQEVLDVAAGDGNFALACAREGAAVVASDLSPAMVERGRARSKAEGFEIEWVEADAEELPFEDGRFDCVGSAFGAMIAPRPEHVADELFRVARPGGTVGLTAWVPGSVTAELIGIARKYVPPPPEQPLSEEWGVEETVRERFGGLAATLEHRHEVLRWEAPSAEQAIADYLAGTPTIVAARQALSPEQYDALALELRELVERSNEAADGSLRVESEYLLTVARKPA